MDSWTCYEGSKTAWAKARVFLRSESRCLYSYSKFLPHRQASLSKRCLRAALWRRAKLLGAGWKTDRDLLLGQIRWTSRCRRKASRIFPWRRSRFRIWRYRQWLWWYWNTKQRKWNMQRISPTWGPSHKTSLANDQKENLENIWRPLLIKVG